MRDAGRGNLYFARYGPETDGRRALLDGPGRAPATEAALRGAGALAVGEDVDAWLEGSGFDGPTKVLRADTRALLAAIVVHDVPPTPPHALAPLYLQASAPERRRAGERDGPWERGGLDRT